MPPAINPKAPKGPVLPMTSFSGGLMSRLQRAKSSQGRALADQRERRQDAEELQAKAEAVARGELKAEALKPKTAEERRHEALLVEFNELFEPIMKHMGCDEEDRRLVRDAWSKPDEIEATLADWYTKVIVYDLEVGSELRERSYNHFRDHVMHNDAVMGLPGPERAGAATTSVESASDVQPTMSVASTQPGSQEPVKAEGVSGAGREPVAPGKPVLRRIGARA